MEGRGWGILPARPVHPRSVEAGAQEALVLDLWYKNAVIYCLDVDTFMDGNGDGIGDFAGPDRAPRLPGRHSASPASGCCRSTRRRTATTATTSRTSTTSTRARHARRLRRVHAPGRASAASGSSSTWSSTTPRPSIPGSRRRAAIPHSPVPRLLRLVREASRRTPTRAWSSPASRRRPGPTTRGAQAYYFHRFYDHQPDLNIANPAVREEIREDHGLLAGARRLRLPDGRRAVPDRAEGRSRASRDVDPYYATWTSCGRSCRGGAATRSCSPRPTWSRRPSPTYFGDGDRIQMMFNFWLNQHLFLALATEDAEPLVTGTDRLPPIPADRPVGELPAQPRRDRPRPPERRRARRGLRGVGPEAGDAALRARHPPAPGADAAAATAPPGAGATACCSRCPARRSSGTATRSAWATTSRCRSATASARRCSGRPSRTAASHSARREAAIRPVVSEGDFALPSRQRRRPATRPGSLLNSTERLIRTRKECPEFGWGEWTLLDAQAPTVLAHCCEWRGRRLLLLHNLSREPAIVRLDLSQHQCDHLIDLLDDPEPSPVEEGCFETRLDGYGYHWYRMGQAVPLSANAGDDEAEKANGKRTRGRSPNGKASAGRTSHGRRASRRARASSAR